MKPNNEVYTSMFFISDRDFTLHMLFKNQQINLYTGLLP